MTTYQYTPPSRRPIGVMILAFLAGIAAVLAIIHCLQALTILPYLAGPDNGIAVRAPNANFWYAFMWAILAYIYFWLVQMLWAVHPSAWLFLAFITVFELVIGGMSLLFSNTSWVEIQATMVVSAVILIYIMLPPIRRQFMRDMPQSSGMAPPAQS